MRRRYIIDMQINKHSTTSFMSAINLLLIHSMYVTLTLNLHDWLTCTFCTWSQNISAKFHENHAKGKGYMQQTQKTKVWPSRVIMTFVPNSCYVHIATMAETFKQIVKESLKKWYKRYGAEKKNGSLNICIPNMKVISQGT